MGLRTFRKLSKYCKYKEQYKSAHNATLENKWFVFANSEGPLYLLWVISFVFDVHKSYTTDNINTIIAIIRTWLFLFDKKGVRQETRLK